jgi:hypothetical protein
LFVEVFIKMISSSVRFQGLVRVNVPHRVELDLRSKNYTDGGNEYLVTPVEHPNTPEALQVPKYQELLAKTAYIIREGANLFAPGLQLMAVVTQNSGLALASEEPETPQRGLATAILTDEDAVQFMAAQGVPFNLADGPVVNQQKFDDWYTPLSPDAKKQFDTALGHYTAFYQACNKPVLNLAPKSFIPEGMKAVITGL